MKLFGTAGLALIADVKDSKGATLVWGDGSAADMIITSVTDSDSEIYNIVKCFEETHKLYAFGRNIKTIDVSATVVDQDYNCIKKDTSWLKTLLQKYETNRVYKTDELTTLTYSTEVSECFVTGLTVRSVQNHPGTYNISLALLVAPK